MDARHFVRRQRCAQTAADPTPLAAKMASSLEAVATHQPQCRAAGWHWRAGAPAQGAAVRQAYLGNTRVQPPGEKNKGLKKKTQPKPRREEMPPAFAQPSFNALGLQSRLEGQMADERSRLLSYSIRAARLHARGAGSAQRTRGKRLALPPSPEASPDPAGTGYFPRSFTTSKKAPGWEGNISSGAHSGVSQRGPCGPAGARRAS